jgi:hypothetical protein
MIAVAEAERVERNIAFAQNQLSKAAWAIEQVLFRLRVNAADGTGITHRAKGDKAELLALLDKTVRESEQRAIDIAQAINEAGYHL